MISNNAVPIPGLTGHSTQPVTDIARYELRFVGLFHAGRGYAFPCDANGSVDLDNLGSRARINYFYARTAIGREFCAPVTRLVPRNEPE